MAELFNDLESSDFFIRYVSEHFSSAPAAVLERFPCKNTLNEDRIKLAFVAYGQNIKTYKLLLHSEDPDHYKRSGALLHALYRNEIVEKVVVSKNQSGEWEDIEATPPLGMSYDEANEMTAIVRFYADYYNQLLSFDLAYLCCASFESHPRTYDFNFLDNICHYLWKNKDLPVDSCSMIFRALMQA